MPEKRYLGDGVYVEFDGYAIILTAEDGIRITHRIVLEPDVYRALASFVEQIRTTPLRRRPDQEHAQ